MSKPKAGALGVETVATYGALNGRNHHPGRPDGPIHSLSTARAGLMVLVIRYTQGSAVGQAHASPWAYTCAPCRGRVPIILDAPRSQHLL